jgi:lambda family phage minor tail protein L
MPIADTIQTEGMKLSTDALVELYILDLNSIGLASVQYFHCGTNENYQPIVFQGITYTPFPVQVTGFESNGQGTLPTPSLKVSNIGGAISQTIIQYNDMVGAKLTRKRTFRKFLDGEPLANPTMEYPLDIFFIGRKTGENADVVTFDLVSSFDLAGLTLPSRQVIQNSCPWVYKSAECSWVPIAGFYFDANDQPVTPGADVCGKRLDSCKCRFASRGANPDLPFGGFPGVRRYT